MVRGGHDWAADALTASPVDMANRAPPVKKPTATGRTCAKRMIMPLPALLVTTANDYSVWSGYIKRVTPPSLRTPSIGHHAQCPALLSSRPSSSPPSGLQAHHHVLTVSRKPHDLAYYWDDPQPSAGSTRIGRTARHVC